MNILSIAYINTLLEKLPTGYKDFPNCSQSSKISASVHLVNYSCYTIQVIDLYETLMNIKRVLEVCLLENSNIVLFKTDVIVLF